MEYLNDEDFGKFIGWSKKQVIKRCCIGLPMPRSVKIPRSKIRLWKLTDVIAWIQEQEKSQAKNDENIVQLNSVISKGNEIRKKRGRPRKAIRMDVFEDFVVNA